MKSRYLFLFILLAFLSCGKKDSHSSGQSAKFNAYPLDTAIVVREAADTTQSYVLYLPPQYKNDGSFPVIFAFDSQGNGGKMVKWLMPAARRYGYVIAGSNNFKNNVKDLDRILSGLMQDLFSRLKVNTQRLYNAGFSGGGRVAVYLTQVDKRFRGVASLSAGLSISMLENKQFCAAAFAGRNDFNYWEVVKISPQVAQSYGIPFWYAVFNGGHQYAPQIYSRLTLLWFEANAMRNGVVKKQKSLIREIKAVWDSIIDSSQTVESQVWAYQSAIKFLSGLKSVKRYQKQLSKLLSSSEYKNYLAEQNEIYRIETYLQQQYVQALKQKDVKWWHKEISALNQKIKTEKDLNYKAMYNRLKEFISIVCFSMARDLIHSGFYDQAKRIVRIYQMDDPENPDVYFYKSCLYMVENKVDSARVALAKARNLGFESWNRLKEYQCFSNVKNVDDFLKNVKK